MKLHTLKEHDIKIDYVILLQPTTPFGPKIIDDTLKHFQNSKLVTL